MKVETDAVSVVFWRWDEMDHNLWTLNNFIQIVHNTCKTVRNIVSDDGTNQPQRVEKTHKTQLVTLCNQGIDIYWWTLVTTTSPQPDIRKMQIVLHSTAAENHLTDLHHLEYNKRKTGPDDSPRKHSRTPTACIHMKYINEHTS